MSWDFRGREREVAALEAGWSATGDEDVPIMVVHGEPGIGKTRTVAEFARSVRDGDGEVLWGTCCEGGSARPYGVWVGAIGGYLVNDLRRHVILPIEHGSGLAVHVGGETATNIDFSHVLSTKLPLFIAVVVLLSFLLLSAVFRSLLIPLVTSIMNLLSIAAALGALNAVFNLGWGASLLGLTAKGPIDAFIPALMFSVLFGLSTDYEVYLVSRIQEEWQRLNPTRGHPLTAGVLATRNNHQAIIAGVALIMVLVFGSFLLSEDRVLEEFGFGLAFAVLIDALIIRTLLVPAIMHRIGPANWAMPAWLDRIVPNLSIEATDDPADPPQVRAAPGIRWRRRAGRHARTPSPGRRVLVRHHRRVTSTQ